MVPGGALTEPAEPTSADTSVDHAVTHAAAPVVLLAGPGESTDIVANFLASRVPDLVVVVENPPSRLRMARRRARRVGWLAVAGQVLFVGVLQPILRRQGARRRAAILGAASVGVTHGAPRPPGAVGERRGDRGTARIARAGPGRGARDSDHRLPSAWSRWAAPSSTCTPASRLATAGSTADTGRWPSGTPSGSAPRCTWWTPESTPARSWRRQPSTSPTRTRSPPTRTCTWCTASLCSGPQVDKVMAGQELEPMPTGIAPGSGLYYHPTLWGYLWRRWRHGVR